MFRCPDRRSAAHAPARASHCPAGAADLHAAAFAHSHVRRRAIRSTMPARCSSRRGRSLSFMSELARRPCHVLLPFAAGRGKRTARGGGFRPVTKSGPGVPNRASTWISMLTMTVVLQLRLRRGIETSAPSFDTAVCTVPAAGSTLYAIENSSGERHIKASVDCQRRGGLRKTRLSQHDIVAGGTFHLQYVIRTTARPSMRTHLGRSSSPAGSPCCSSK